MSNQTLSSLEIIRNIYDAFDRGDVPGVLGAMAADIEWNEAENFPYADRNPYIGPDAVAEGVFGRIMAEWEFWNLEQRHLQSLGDNGVLCTGRYHARNKETGKVLNAQFAHVWKLENGKAKTFQQYADTAQAQAAIS